MTASAFACYCKNDAIRLVSSSGGIFYLIAKAVISSGGIVYAACYNGIDVIHERITSENEVIKGCGSKYVPSKLSDIFHHIRRDLSNGSVVLFVGTPCQCAGLRSFIGECNKLILIDFVCHGIPSKSVYRSYILEKEKDGGKIRSINMRDKTFGWEDYCFTINYESGRIERIQHLEVPYIKGMLNDLYLRPSCYCCNFKGLDRITDITIGDAWGASTYAPDMNDNKGLSVILIHSNTGESLLKSIANELEMKTISTKDYVKANPYIVQSAEHTRKRDSFFKMYNNNVAIDDIVKYLTKKSIVRNIYRHLFCK